MELVGNLLGNGVVREKFQFKMQLRQVEIIFILWTAIGHGQIALGNPKRAESLWLEKTKWNVETLLGQKSSLTLSPYGIRSEESFFF